MTLDPGSLFAGYEIRKKLGQGGMGAVYLAHEPRHDRLVALKVLHGFFAEDEQYIQRFRREARILAKLVHPHIVRLHDTGQADDILWMSMDFIEAGIDAGGLPSGLDMAKRLSSSQLLSIDEGIGLLTSIARALDFAHKRQVIHRDLKPSNILLDADGEAYLADFGIAKLREGSATGGYLVGTYEYMAPEQWRGDEIDHRADLYSLGVVAYEWLAGQRPFASDRAVGMAWRVAKDGLNKCLQMC